MRPGIVLALIFSAGLAPISAFAAAPQTAKTVHPKILNGTAHGVGLSFNFDEAEVDGKSKGPMATSVTARAQDQRLDLIRVRLHWTIEMIQSTGKLSL